MGECFLFNSLLLDFHTVRFSGSSGYFLFLNFLSFLGCVKRQSVSTYASILARSFPLASCMEWLPDPLSSQSSFSRFFLVLCAASNVTFWGSPCHKYPSWIVEPSVSLLVSHLVVAPLPTHIFKSSLQVIQQLASKHKKMIAGETLMIKDIQGNLIHFGKQRSPLFPGAYPLF